MYKKQCTSCSHPFPSLHYPLQRNYRPLGFGYLFESPGYNPVGRVIGRHTYLYPIANHDFYISVQQFPGAFRLDNHILALHFHHPESQRLRYHAFHLN